MTDHLNPPEFRTLTVGWLFTLVLWFFLIVIAVCEPDLNDDGGICIFYTYKYDGNYTTTDAESSSTGDSMDGGTVPDYKYNRKAYFFVYVGVAYFCNLVMMVYSITTMYLSNRVDMTIEEYQRHLIDARPTCWLKIECWHRGSKNKRVVTKREKEEFQFASFKSHCCVTGVGVTRKEEKEEEKEAELQEYVSFSGLCEERSAPSAATRLRITTKLEFLDGQTRTAYKDQLDSFVRQHTSDTYQAISEDLSIPKCDRFVLVVSPGQQLTYTTAFYCLCGLLSLTIPYATYFYWSTKAVDLVVTKEVSMIEYGAVVDNAPRTINYNDEPIEYV
eukprot:TRINITY_DN400_c0_g3_i1.p1 TRINITY_DN400_c0_g3~~TRINITY_DN400_c0_g3_i1.p1  ORF type:complete len:358 (+),score=42.23 TRINITY_DN400_c0_g3_i1:83-1075(+)